MKIDSQQSAEEKAKYDVVRLDTGETVPGQIVSANEETGECSMSIKGETKTFSFPSAGIRIVASNPRRY